MLRGPGRHVATLVAIGVAFVAVVAVAALITRSEASTAIVAAVATALIVAWQSLETARAATAAEEGLRGAADSLRVSQALAIEAERRRLDAEGPHLLVRVEPVEWPPRIGRQFVASEPVQYEEGATFRLPKDGSRHVMLRADGYVRNEGDRTVHVSMRDMRIEDSSVHTPPGEATWTEPGIHDVDLRPGDQERFRYEASHTASDWIANSEAAERNAKEPTFGLGEIVANDDRDNGVIDWWMVEVSGRPLERIADEQGSWRIPRTLLSNIPVAAIVRPRVRHYYRSKWRSEQLPEIDLPANPAPDGRARP